MQATRCKVSIQSEPGVKHHPTVTENEQTERNNSFAALTYEQGTNRMPETGKIAQEAKAQGNAWDTLTWAWMAGM